MLPLLSSCPYKRYRRDADKIEEASARDCRWCRSFGQIICRLLRANGNIPIVALDLEIEQIEILRNIRIKSYFGDAISSDLARNRWDCECAS